MAKTVKIDQLADEMNSIMKMYNDDVSAAIETTLDNTGEAIRMDAATNALTEQENTLRVSPSRKTEWWRF